MLEIVLNILRVCLTNIFNCFLTEKTVYENVTFSSYIKTIQIVYDLLLSLKPTIPQYFL